jgi:hypothetical protein
LYAEDKDNCQENFTVTNGYQTKVAADIPDIVKQKRPIHCPLFYREIFISYAGHKKHELTTPEISDVCYTC